MKTQKDVRKLSNKEIALHSAQFFKTKKGEYGYGDKFLGIRVPALRSIAKKNKDLSFADTKTLMQSKFHEERLLGLIILTHKYSQATCQDDQSKIFDIYVNHFQYINNWDLVDTTCPHIIGKHLFARDRKILYTWAKSENLWIKRISIVANWWFIRNNDLRDIFKISKILINDEHDLIHKAVGWMLREAGKKDRKKLENFLKRNYLTMPRTMLRYSIEKFDQKRRQQYLKGRI